VIQRDLDFDGEYLWDRLIYEKVGKASDLLHPTIPRWIKIGKLWSTNDIVVDMQVDPPMINTLHTDSGGISTP